jgi:crossover junction endodeoxyribonuclease RuvC
VSTYIGIDPGKNGAIAFIADGAMIVHSMPKTPRDMWVLLSPFEGSRCVLEKVASMPGQGVKSMFTFGRYYGMAEGIVAAAGLRTELVKPERWQTALGCLSGGNKAVTHERARLLFPGVVIHKYAADAVLLAEYCRRLFSEASHEKAS